MQSATSIEPLSPCSTVFKIAVLRKISLLGGFEVQKLDGERAIARVAARAPEELMKDGIAIKSWKTTPNDARLFVHERADAAISNKPKIEIVSHAYPSSFER